MKESIMTLRIEPKESIDINELNEGDLCLIENSSNSLYFCKLKDSCHIFCEQELINSEERWVLYMNKLKRDMNEEKKETLHQQKRDV